LKGKNQERTRGRKRIETRSSIFSTRAIANPPSRGIAKAARKPPKIGCGNESRNGQSLLADRDGSESAHVNSDDVGDEGRGEDEEEGQSPVAQKDTIHHQLRVKTVKRGVGRTYIITGVGWPASMLPVRTASQWNAFLMGKMRTRVHPIAQRSMYKAVRPEAFAPAEALTRATVSARRTQPTTSFPTPAERTTTPTVVSRSLHSVRIRQRTGKAVLEEDKEAGRSQLQVRVQSRKKSMEMDAHAHGGSDEEEEVSEGGVGGIDKVVVDGDGDLRFEEGD
jgi:hypothetical protein